MGQLEMNFRKIKFSVAAKHAGLGENDFLKSFSPKTNAALVTFVSYPTFCGEMTRFSVFIGVWETMPKPKNCD